VEADAAMSGAAQRYPLSWPVGWRRTPAGQRRRAAFAKSVRAVDRGTGQVVTGAATRPLTVADAIARLSAELARLGATGEILSTNVETRLDGLPRSGQAEPRDPGAAVYFQLKGKATALACDKWDRIADNIAALAQHIDALRRIDRYGVGTLAQAFAGYAALPASTESWVTVLGVAPTATLAEIEDAFRRLAKAAHPDVGGSHEQMTRLIAARDAARHDRGAA
jgi:hypothetical protein